MSTAYHLATRISNRRCSLELEVVIGVAVEERGVAVDITITMAEVGMGATLVGVMDTTIAERACYILKE